MSNQVTEVLRNQKSFIATASLVAAGQFRFVKMDANGGVVLATEGSNAIGVNQDKPGAGDPCMVCGPGDITKVYCGGSFNPGDLIGSDGSGNAIAVDTGDYVLGVARTNGGAGWLASILFQPRGGTA